MLNEIKQNIIWHGYGEMGKFRIGKSRKMTM